MSLREKRISVPIGLIGFEKLQKEAEQQGKTVAQLVRDRIAGNNGQINTELREITEVMLKYRALYNELIQWLEDGKLGYTKLMVPSEQERLKEVHDKW